MIHTPEFIAEVSNPANWLPVPEMGKFGATGVLTGQDSVSASGMTSGHDVYCGYGGSSGFSNMASVKSRFPGKKYLVFDTHVSKVDCYDIEPGGGSAGSAGTFFRQWAKVNLDKPAFYASASGMGAVKSALSGIARSSYYLIVAQWDGSPSIPSGYDGKQYGNTAGYDSDSFQSYMWGGVVTPPVPPGPLPVSWVYPPVAGLLVTPEVTGAFVAFGAPHLASGMPAVGLYEIAISQGTKLDRVISGYPLYESSSGTISCSGLTAGTQYIVAVRAMTVAKTRGSQWAEARFATRPSGGGPTPPPVTSGYVNPLRGIKGLVAQRVDQGTDYAGSGPLYSLGNGVVLNTLNSGWPGGAFISVRLSDGPAAGKIFYYAENIAPIAVTVGQRVTSSTVLGTLINAYPNCELGWAAEPGTGETMARAAGNLPASHANTAFGKNFSDLLVSLGAPAGTLSGPVVGTLPAGWPTWSGASVTPPVITPPVIPPVTGFPLQQGSTGVLVVNLQRGLNTWGLGNSGTSSADGKYGPNTALAVTGAQLHFSQHGAIAGECNQALYDKLLTTPPTPVTPPPPVAGKYPSASQAVGQNGVQLNGEIMYGFFRQSGYSEVAAAGAIASIWGESTWNPESAGTGGRGLIGWTPESTLPNSAFTGNPGADMAAQLLLILRFVITSGDTAAVASMQNAATVLDAANIWGVRVERFGINDVHAAGVTAAKAIARKLDGVNLA